MGEARDQDWSQSSLHAGVHPRSRSSWYKRNGLEEMVAGGSDVDVPKGLEGPLFYPKRVGLAIQNMLLSEKCNVAAVVSWWSQTNITNNFWIEDPEALGPRPL